MKVAWLHPDLGIGGAERFVVNACIQISKTHNCSVFVNHFDASRCFVDVNQLKVLCFFSWVPRHFFGKFHAFLAYFKMCLLAVICCVFYSDVDIFIVDQVSAPIELLKYLSGKPVVFYCHYPDAYLSEKDGTYRRFLKCWELRAMSKATKIFANSEFTRNAMSSAFKEIGLSMEHVEIMYPYFHFESFERVKRVDFDLQHPPYSFLSINRFDPAKKIELAIFALSSLIQEGWDMRLEIVGGYDDRILAQVEYIDYLYDLAFELDLLDSKRVVFHTNICEFKKEALLSKSIGVLYTPSNEHFGLIPFECLSRRVMVIAQNNGGPGEMLEDHAMLCDGSIEGFASAMKALVTTKQLNERLDASYRWIKTQFDPEELVNRLLLQI